MANKTSKKENTSASGKLSELKEKLRVIRFKVEGTKPKNVKEVRELKKEIARALTEMNKSSKKEA